MDRAAALERLGVRPQTLYAYVSRGRIGMRADPLDSRRSLYSAEDVEELVGRRQRGRRRSAIAASTMEWGEPAIPTAISTVWRGRLLYRGVEATTLAERATFEDVASLLWEADVPVAFPSSSASRARDGRTAAFAALAALSAARPPSIGRSRANLWADAAEVTGALAGAFGAEPRVSGARRRARPIHESLVRGWQLDGPAADVVRRALVLLADHELNASAFAARVAASTGASLAASLLAGLAALTGPRHGGAADALASFAAEAERLGAEPAVARWLARDASLPGFGHPLYPEGDPRVGVMLQGVTLDRGLASLRDAVAAATASRPNVDFALAVLVRAYQMPPDAPFRLFALGRSVGWAAHAIEQAATGRLIRPRGRYEGPLPDE